MSVSKTTDRWENPRSWEAWKSLFSVEHNLHGKPFGASCDVEDYKEFFDNGYGPHEAIEEAFNDA